MADIDTYINQIRHAVYGREVREAIAAGIEACNEDSSEAKELSNQASTEASSAIEMASSASQNMNNVLIDLSADKTASGNPIVVEDAKALPIKKATITINPIRELHGYSNPWIGGTRKNLLQVTAQNSGIFTVWTDGEGNTSSIYAKGTPSELVRFGNGFALSAGEYILTGCPEGGSDSTYNLSIRSGSIDGSIIGDLDVGSGANITIPSDGTYYYSITVNADVRMSKTFYPMIRLATEEDPTYEPYANICRISGLSSVMFNIATKNLIDEQHPYAVGKRPDSDNGLLVDDADYDTYFIPAYKGVKMFFLAKAIVSGHNIIEVTRYDLDMHRMSWNAVLNFIMPGSNLPVQNWTSLSDTPTSDGYYAVAFYKPGILPSSCLVRFNSTLVAYDEYAGSNHQIDLESVAGSAVYGGTLTINEDGSGELVIDRTKVHPTADDVALLSNSKFQYHLKQRCLAGTLRTWQDVISNILPTATDEQISSKSTLHENFCYSSIDLHYVCWNTNKEYDSISDMLADLDGLEFVFYLAGSDIITYSLSADVVRMLEGAVSVYSDPVNTIELEYRATGIRGGSVTITEAQLQTLLNIAQTTAVITTQPKTVHVYDGETATFTVEAINVEKYQWQQSMDNGETWSDVDCTESTYSFVKTLDSPKIRCKITSVNEIVVYTDIVKVW